VSQRRKPPKLKMSQQIRPQQHQILLIHDFRL
jgi:hypothetical protein